MSPETNGLLSLPRPPGLGWAASLFERVTGLHRLARLYYERPAALDPTGFVRFALRQVGLSWRLASGDSAAIPKQGGLIVVANHPYGAADGLALADLLLRQRQDVLLLANTLLQRLPELAPLIAPVDVFRAGASAPGLRAALRHLEAGGVLVVFPAGEVSRWDWRRRRIADPPWADSVAMLARRSGAQLLPVRIAGQADWRSLLAGALHPRLRTACLVRDLLRLRGRTLDLHLGEPLQASELARLQAPTQTAYLRLLTYSLGGRSRPLPPVVAAPIAEALPADSLAAEIEALPASARLCVQQDFSVYLAPAALIPQVLDEIGRLREMSFRLVQEGTGRARDLDRFDAHYQHLFIWHATRREIVGAYRLGFTQPITAAQGVSGLYTHTLFEYDRRLLDRIGPAIELGRSFVRPEWQRNFRSLRLLWSGIATVLDRNPDIRSLFGPVSISPSYSAAGQALIEAALSAHHSDAELRALIRPRTPPQKPRAIEETRNVVSALGDPSLLSRVLSRLERGMGLPVLVRHYMELNGRFAGFNVDADFGSTLDGLVFIRVADIPAKVRMKFGALGAES
jgi:putative hemolysin